MSFPRCNALFLDFFKFTTNAIPGHIAWKRAKFLFKCFQCFCLTVGNAMAKWLILARLIESVEPSLDWTTFWTTF